MEDESLDNLLQNFGWVCYLFCRHDTAHLFCVCFIVRFAFNLKTVVAKTYPCISVRNMYNKQKATRYFSLFGDSFNLPGNLPLHQMFLFSQTTTRLVLTMKFYPKILNMH